MSGDLDAVLVLWPGGRAGAFLTRQEATSALYGATRGSSLPRTRWTARWSDALDALPRPVAVSLDGRVLELDTEGTALVDAGPMDEAELQALLDEAADRLGLPTPVTDRVALTDAVLREQWERPPSGPWPFGPLVDRMLRRSRPAQPPRITPHP